MPAKTWVTNEVLTSTDVNTYLGKQVVTSCTSATRPASPADGQPIYETDTDRVMVYDGAAWQVVSHTGAWMSWSPTWKQGATTLTTIGGTSRYKVDGKTCTAMFLFGTTSTGTAGQVITVSLPVAARTYHGGLDMGVGRMKLGGTWRVGALGLYTDVSTVALTIDNNANVAGISPSVAVANGDSAVGTVTYEIA